MIKLRSVVGFIETWRENTTISMCSERQSIFTANENVNNANVNNADFELVFVGRVIYLA